MFTSRAQPLRLSGSHASLLSTSTRLPIPTLCGAAAALCPSPCPSPRPCELPLPQQQSGAASSPQDGARAEAACPASTPCPQVPLRQESGHRAISHCRPQHRIPREDQGLLKEGAREGAACTSTGGSSIHRCIRCACCFLFKLLASSWPEHEALTEF